MDSRYSTPEQALNAILGEFEQDCDVADFFDVEPPYIHHYKTTGKMWRKLRLAVKNKFPYLKRQRVRTEITWESEQQRRAMLVLANKFGHDTIQDYCRWRADCELEAQSLDAAAELIGKK